MANIFIPRNYSIVEGEYSLDFDILLKKLITIISGDAGVGKTYQLKKYYVNMKKHHCILILQILILSCIKILKKI